MVTMLSPFEIDLPGELHEPAEILPFPGSWEPDPEPPTTCPLCLAECDPEPSGLCHVCAARLPHQGGCGLGVTLAVALGADGDNTTALGHLIDCRPCREHFDGLATVARVAHMEADTATPHAELLTVAA